MRPIKMFGLAMLAVAATMALVGVGTASATTLHLCEGPSYTACVNKEAGTHDLANGTTFKSNLVAGTEAILTSGFITVKCTVSKINGELTEAQPPEGKQIQGIIKNEAGAVTWENCKQAGEPCTATAYQLPWEIHVVQQRTKTDGTEQTEKEEAEGKGTYIGNGRMWVNPNKAGTTEEGEQPGAEVKCKVFGFGEPLCKYHVNETQPTYKEHQAGKLHIKGGKPAKVIANSLALKLDANGSSGFCSATGTWKAEYEIHSIKQPTLPEVVEPTLWVVHR